MLSNISTFDKEIESLLNNPKEASKDLFLCYECQKYIPYIINLIPCSEKYYIIGSCPCGFTFNEELYEFMRKVYSIEEKDDMNSKESSMCKSHRNPLKNICKDCYQVICDKCGEIDYHSIAPLKRENKKLELNEYNNKIEVCLKEIKELTKKFYVDITNSKELAESYNSMLKRVLGQMYLCRSVLFTLSKNKQNPHMVNNMYFISNLNQFNFKENISNIKENNLIHFFKLFNFLEIFEYVSIDIIIIANQLFEQYQKF